MYDYNYFRSEDAKYEEANYDDINYDNIPEDMEPFNEFYCPYLQFYAAHPPMFMSRQQHQLPPGPPPSHTPKKAPGGPGLHGVQPQMVSPTSLRPCLFKYTYIWPKRGNGFWAWLTYVERRTVSGYRWYRNRWAYFGMDTRQIDSFMC